MFTKILRTSIIFCQFNPGIRKFLLYLISCRQKDISKFHVQLAVSLMLMLIVFVAGIDRTKNRAGCITVGVLLHCLILVAWMWMGAG